MIRLPIGPVNRLTAFWRLSPALLVVACAGLSVASCHLGRPPATAARVGHVDAPVAEPGVPEAVRGGLSAALARRSALGGTRVIDCQILVAESLPDAVGQDGAQVHRARLQVRYAVSGSRPAQVTLAAERSFRLPVGDSLAAERARAAAFATLARQLGTEAADWATALR